MNTKLRDYSSVASRRAALEAETGVSLPHMGSFTLDEADASSRHCENMIGVSQVPTGVAGPLMVIGADGAKHAYYVPLATTEGALVASVNRGCSATADSGIQVQSVSSGVTRGPVFAVSDMAENARLGQFLDMNLPKMKRVAEETSSHLTLLGVTSTAVGTYRYVRFSYDTQDAMGLNMVTIATDAVARFIERETSARCVALSGNYCVDKKPSWQNVIRGRGHEVRAEAIIGRETLRRVLKTTAKSVYDVWVAKCMVGSAVSGSMGFNAQYANIVAAMFIATGQDPAHVVEGSAGITMAEIMNGDDLRISVYIPNVMVGTVGGGTGLATQKEALSLLGVAGGDHGENAGKLAGIVGAAALAGEVSLLASLGEGTLASSHRKFARGANA